MNGPDWQWDEMQQVGTDYTDTAEVAAYDKRMGTFRNLNAENRRILKALDLKPRSSVLELGCGTGRFACAAAAEGHSVCAADVSLTMLSYVREKAAAKGLFISELQHAGFLTLKSAAERFDAVVSNAALHHLPDAWKLTALENIARVLKPGGRLLLGDVVFSASSGVLSTDCMEHFVESFPQMHAEVARHTAREFSTYDWIMEGLIARAGLEILSVDPAPNSFIAYLCRK